MMMIIIIINSNKFIIKRKIEMIKGVHNLSNSPISSSWKIVVLFDIMGV